MTPKSWWKRKVFEMAASFFFMYRKTPTNQSPWLTKLFYYKSSSRRSRRLWWMWSSTNLLVCIWTAPSGMFISTGHKPLYPSHLNHQCRPQWACLQVPPRLSLKITQERPIRAKWHVLKVLSAMYWNEDFLFYLQLKWQFNQSEFQWPKFCVRLAGSYVLWVTWYETDTQTGRGEMGQSLFYPTPRACRAKAVWS